MALFKISKGLSANLPANRVDGYCYFTSDDQKFYIDWLDEDNSIIERSPLNAHNADLLSGAALTLSDGTAGFNLIEADALKIPNSLAVYNKFVDTQVLIDTKMNIENPLGTGYFSMNRKSASTIGLYSATLGYDNVASGNYSAALGLGTVAQGKAQLVIGQYNIADTSGADATTGLSNNIFIIGAGVSDGERKNVFVIDRWGSFLAAGNGTINGNLAVGGVISAGEPAAANNLTTKKYVDDNLPQLNHVYIEAAAGQASFDFGTLGLTNLDKYCLVYYNGLLLIEGLHYTLDSTKTIVALDGWTATAGSQCHVVSFKPTNPAN